MVGNLASIQRRLTALDGRGPGGSGAGGRGGCGYCGGGDDDHHDEPYEVYFEDEVPEDLEGECPECGEELITTIYFDDDPRAPWQRSEGGAT